MNEKNRTKIFGSVALCGLVSMLCCFAAAALGSNAFLWLTAACANLGYAVVFGIIALRRSKLAKAEGNSSTVPTGDS
jgi:hypothetical protein